VTAETPGRRKRTAREAAVLLGVSERTIRNIVAEPRDDYEARARERRNRAAELRKQGLLYREIAETMGCSIGTVGRLLYDVRKYATPDQRGNVAS